MKHTYSINLYLFEMKRIILCLCLMLSLSGFAQNRWKIYAGGSISHDCGGYFEWNADGNTGFDWGGGAFLGGGYEINFNKNWSFTPHWNSHTPTMEHTIIKPAYPHIIHMDMESLIYGPVRGLSTYLWKQASDSPSAIM